MRVLDRRTDQPIEATLHRYSAGSPVPMRPLPGYPDDVEGYPDDEPTAVLEETARPRFEGNRRARRKAAALAQKGVIVMPPVLYPASPDTLRVARGQAVVRQA